MRRFLIVLLFLLCVAPASAQIPGVRLGWGVMGGINIPDFSTDLTRADVKNKMGWQVGLVTSLKVGFVAVEPQIFYVRQGLRIRPAGGDELNLKSNSVDVPILVSFRLISPLRIYAGPVFTVMNDCKRKTGDDLIDFGRVRPTLSYTAGVGVTLLRHLLVDLRFNGQFRAKQDVLLPDGSRLDKLRLYNVALSFGYLF